MAEIKKIRYVVINENHYRIGDRINHLIWINKDGEKRHLYNAIVYHIADDGFTMWDEDAEVKEWVSITNVIKE